MAARLKVFGWSDGFHSWTVATTSRPKALQAWNVEQDLFKSGLASEIAAGPERDTALAAPGTVIKTGMAIDPGMIEALKPDPQRVERQKARARAEEIQSRIDDLDRELEHAVDQLRTERAVLDERIAILEAEADRKRAALRKSLKAARS